MTSKEKILTLLQENTGKFLSGQEIADTIFLTRAAVWKSIKALEKEGYSIEAVTNKGYRLKPNIDNIDVSYIKNSICKEWKKAKVLYYDQIDSTNDEAKRLAESSFDDLIIISNKQTNGHGRRGRDFYSPEYTGLYLSILIHSNNEITRLANITGIAATATAKAIDEVIFDNQDITGIKWVNDIFVNGKKVAGILSEACTYMEDECSNYVVIGFGINVFEPSSGFPKEIKKTAGSLIGNNSNKTIDSIKDISLIRSKLATTIINNLIKYKNDSQESLKIYRNKSILIGNYIKINSFANKKTSKSESKKYAKVTGINSKYHLLIEYDNGDKEELSSGEVSVIKY